MSMQAKNQYLHTLITQSGGYHLASKKAKWRILNEYCRVTGQNRKYAIRKIRNGSYVHTMRKEKGEERRVRRSFYDRDVAAFLIRLWEIFDRPCGQRMKEQIACELDRLIQFGEMRVSSDMTAKLKRISAREIDNTLKPHKEKERLKQKHGKKIHPLLYKKIPIKTASEHDRKGIGNLQIDLVEHCGQSASGAYLYTLSTTDLATSWWEGGVVLTKSMKRIHTLMDVLRRRYPFAWKSFHSDNDTAFINGHLYRYAKNNHLHFTRSRPYEKNDNFLVEQKNGRVVRKSVGYLRYDTERERHILTELHILTGLSHNFFQPVMKLKEKRRIGSKLVRRFEKPQTPYQRVLKSNHVSQESKRRLKVLYVTLNPAELRRQIDAKRDELYHAYRSKGRGAQTVEQLTKKLAPTVTFSNCRTDAVLVT